MARVVKINWERELAKFNRGQKTKLPPEIVLYECMRVWNFSCSAKVQRALIKAFPSVREWAEQIITA